MKIRALPLPVAAMILDLALASPAGAIERPVVVELFTSQGCSSCPPADQVLGELAGRPDVLALSFHVTYWDRLGWPDSFGLAAATDRQYAYARMMDRERVYTPQMVIDGRVELVGSRRSAVLEIIRLLRERRTARPELRLSDGELTVGAGPAGARSGSSRSTLGTRSGSRAARMPGEPSPTTTSCVSFARWRAGTVQPPAFRSDSTTGTARQARRSCCRRTTGRS